MTTARRQIGLGPLLAGAGALVLLISLFVDWFDPGFSAWTVFEIVDLLLAMLALAALLAVARRFAPAAFAGQPDVPLWALGLAALVLVATQIVNHPPAAQGAGTEAGAWLALAGALVLLAGSLLRRVSVTVAVQEEDRPATPPPMPPPPARDAPTGDTAVMPGERDPISGQPTG